MKFKFFEKPVEPDYQTNRTYPDDIITAWDRLAYDEGGAAAVRCWNDDRIALILPPYEIHSISYERWCRGYQDTWTNLTNTNQPINPNPFYREGWHAYFNGVPSQSNPHTTGNTISLWIQGWLEAREYIRELNQGWLE